MKRSGTVTSYSVPRLRAEGHAAYAAGWKKFEPLWDWLIRARRVGRALPVLETVLEGFARWRRPATRSDEREEDLGLAQGGHGSGSASGGRGIRETLVALR